MRSGILGFSVAATLVIGMAGVASAQTNVLFRDPSSEIDGFTLPPPAGPDGDWAVNENWFEPGFQGRLVPDVNFNETAVISNGGVATLSVSSPAELVTPGGLNIPNGGLDITGTGALNVAAGTQTNGTVILGGAATGFVNVSPGGSFTAAGAFISQPDSGNLLTVGGTDAGTATVMLDSATFNGTTHVFPNADFSVTNVVNFGSLSNYNVEITGPGSRGFIDVGGAATFNGSIDLSFSGVQPSFGDSWSILEADSIDGVITGVTHNAMLAGNENLIVTRIDDIGNGRASLTASVVEVLKLQVDRDSGTATIRNEGTTPIGLDAYFIGSSVGSLSADPADWMSFSERALLGGDWVETAQTTGNIGELKIGGDASIGIGEEIELGNIYNAFSGQFGQSGEDLQFGYRRSSDSIEFQGLVEYTGDNANTLVLQVDPAGTGDAFLRNTSQTTVQIDGYDVLSDGGSIDPDGWNSLDEQGADADAWLEVLGAARSANQIGEFNSASFTSLGPGQNLNLGPLFTGGGQDLDFSFLMMGESQGTPGVVIYEAFTPGGAVPGDYNNDGVVGAADYVVWRDALGGDSLPNEGDGISPGVVDQDDYDFWKSRYGATSGLGAAAGAAVPEPGTALLIVAGAMAACGCRRRSIV